MVDTFYREVAHKLVCMNSCDIDYTELRVLVLTSLFLECKEQGRLNIL